MFTHVMIGSNDLERSRAFFDATFVALGGNSGEMDARGRLIYAHEGGRLMITTPIDGKPATAANGGTNRKPRPCARMVCRRYCARRHRDREPACGAPEWILRRLSSGSRWQQIDRQS